LGEQLIGTVWGDFCMGTTIIFFTICACVCVCVQQMPIMFFNICACVCVCVCVCVCPTDAHFVAHIVFLDLCVEGLHLAAFS
jgi:hypothetical protein